MGVWQEAAFRRGEVPSLGVQMTFIVFVLFPLLFGHFLTLLTPPTLPCILQRFSAVPLFLSTISTFSTFSFDAFRRLHSLMAIACEVANGSTFSLSPHVNCYNPGVQSAIVGSFGSIGGVIFAIIFRFFPANGFATAWWASGVSLLFPRPFFVETDGECRFWRWELMPSALLFPLPVISLEFYL